MTSKRLERGGLLRGWRKEVPVVRGDAVEGRVSPLGIMQSPRWLAPKGSGGTQTGPSGIDQAVRWYFDGLDNVTKVSALDRNADGNSSDDENTTYLFLDPYDANTDNDLGEVINDTVTTYTRYDKVHEVRQNHAGLATASSPKVTFAYDTRQASSVYTASLRPTSMTYPSTKRLDWSYNTGGSIDDRLDRVHTISGNVTGSTKNLVQYKYNGLDRVAEPRYPPTGVYSPLSSGGNTHFDTLDRFGRVKSKLWKKGSVVDQFDYVYDYAGNRQQRKVVLASSLDQTYTYDGRSRLKSMTSAGGDQTWSLDAWGNWNSLTATGGGLSMSMAHNGANEITALNFTSAHVGHDAAGNMTKVPKPNSVTSHFDMEYDPWNRLVKVTDGSTTVAEYAYDGNHRRIVKTTGGVQQHYYYNPSYQVVEVRKGASPSRTGANSTSPNPIERYVWHPYYIDALAVRFYDANTDGVGVEHFASHDGNYNVTALYNSTGSVVERYHYKPYGQLEVLTANHTPTGTASSVANPYTYTGRRFDSETGLYYYRNRYYNSQLGRFITRDPIGYEGSEWNLYEYVEGGATLNADPYGLTTKEKDAVDGWIDGLQNLDTLVDFADALDENRAAVPWDVVGGVAKNAIHTYIDALQEFRPKSHCGKWYGDTIKAVLTAKDPSRNCSSKGCRKIFQPTGNDSGRYAKCHGDLLVKGQAGSASEQFAKLARKLEKGCSDAAKECEKCKTD